jgi:hypothetical protein
MKTRSERTGKEIFRLKAHWQKKSIKVDWFIDERWLATLTLKPEHTVAAASRTGNRHDDPQSAHERFD